jgi:hypothetical protein
MIKVLITGGSGFIGTHLTHLLRQQGHHVEHIGRTRNSRAGVKTWLWDPKKQWIEEGVFNTEHYTGFHLVHLAGEGIIDKPWTAARKRSIVSSRVDTLVFLYESCVQRNVFPLSVVSASGISYYGTTTSDHIYTENDLPADDFLGRCCVEWEQAARQFEKHCPVTSLRTPLVLDRNEGGLPMMDRKFLWFRPVVGSGKQWVPWVHINDLCRAYVFALSNRLKGAYNVIAPTHVGYKELIRALHHAKEKKRFEFTGSRIPSPFVSIPVPIWAIKLLYGQRHLLVTEGSRISGQKLQQAGYTFDFPGINEALVDVYC